MARRADSFDKCYRKIARLLSELRRQGETVVSAQSDSALPLEAINREPAREKSVLITKTLIEV